MLVAEPVPVVERVLVVEPLPLVELELEVEPVLVLIDDVLGPLGRDDEPEVLDVGRAVPVEPLEELVDCHSNHEFDPESLSLSPLFTAQPKLFEMVALVMPEILPELV